VVIETAFNSLKNKWWILKHFNYKVERQAFVFRDDNTNVGTIMSINFESLRNRACKLLGVQGQPKRN
jgi:hypothetical protein